MMGLMWLAPGSENASRRAFGVVTKRFVQVIYSFMSIRHRCFIILHLLSTNFLQQFQNTIHQRRETRPENAIRQLRHSRFFRKLPLLEKKKKPKGHQHLLLQFTSKIILYFIIRVQDCSDRILQALFLHLLSGGASPNQTRTKSKRILMNSFLSFELSLSPQLCLLFHNCNSHFYLTSPSATVTKMRNEDCGSAIVNSRSI